MTMNRRSVVFLGRFCDAFIRRGILKSFGVLVPAMTVYLNTNYATIGLILSLNAAFTQLACMLMNPVMKRYGTRGIATIGGLVSGVCILCTALTHSVYVTGFLFLTSGFFAAASNLGAATTLQQHFGPRFGAMNSLALIGTSVGSTLLPLLTAELHRYYGLSGTLLILGGLLLNEFPIGALMVSPRSSEEHKRAVPREKYCDGMQDMKTLSTQNGNNNVDDTIVECHTQNGTLYCQERMSSKKSPCWDCVNVLKHTFDFRIFREEMHFTLFMLPVLILSSLANYGWLVFVTSYAISVGVDTFRAAYLAVVGAAGGVASCALQAVVFHKRPHWSPHLMAVLCFTGALTLMLQTLNSTFPHLLVCSFVIGASLYGVSAVVDAVVAVIVAPHNFQAAISFTFALEGIGTLVAGPFSGFLFDTTGSFRTVFLVLGGIAGLAHVLGVLLIISRKYHRKRYKAVKTAIPEEHL